jgi:hypothetical protein
VSTLADLVLRGNSGELLPALVKELRASEA